MYTRECTPFDSLILHFRDLVLDELQHLVENLDLRRLVAVERLRVLADLLHQVAQTHVPIHTDEIASSNLKSHRIRLPEILVGRLHLWRASEEESTRSASNTCLLYKLVHHICFRHGGQQRWWDVASRRRVAVSSPRDERDMGRTSVRSVNRATRPREGSRL